MKTLIFLIVVLGLAGCRSLKKTDSRIQKASAFTLQGQHLESIWRENESRARWLYYHTDSGFYFHPDSGIRSQSGGLLWFNDLHLGDLYRSDKSDSIIMGRKSQETSAHQTVTEKKDNRWTWILVLSLLLLAGFGWFFLKFRGRGWL